MLSLTPRALSAIKSVCSAPDQGLRIMVVTGGCSGLQYRMGLETEAFDDDQVMEFDGVKVYVDPSSQVLLAGATMDYVDSAMGAGFMFDNPNNTAKPCSCSSKSCG
ncbi:MAG: iron-sulfur cluster assembly accessory protein [Pseudomonadota bacterium]